MRKLDHDQIAMCCHSLNGLQISPEGEAARDGLDRMIQNARQNNIERISLTPDELDRALNASQRPFTSDEFKRFIDRLVWACGNSPGGRLDDDQRAKMSADIALILDGCARVANPNKVIAERLLTWLELQFAAIEAVPLDFNDFTKRCNGEQV